MVVRQPELLLYLPSTLQQHMAALKTSLRIPHEVAQLMLWHNPNLLMYSPGVVQVRASLHPGHLDIGQNDFV